MANDLAIGLIIGATLSSSFRSAFSGAQKTVDRLGSSLGQAMEKRAKTADKINRSQERQIALQQRISKAIYEGDANAGKLIHRYERIQSVLARTVERQNKFTQAIERANKAQTALSNAVAKQEERHRQREKYKGDMVSAVASTTAIAFPAWRSVKTYMEQENASNDLKVAMMKRDGSYGKFEEIDKLTEALGKRLPGSKADFTRDAIALKNQGISDDVVLNGGLKTSAELGVLLDMKYGESGEFLAKFMEARGLKESELPQAADYLQRAKFAGGLTKEQMYGSMSYNASTVRGLGLTGLENTKKLLALEGMSGQQGLEGTSFGTNFSAMLERLNKGPKMLALAKKGMKAEARDIMKASGVDFQFFDKKGNFKGIDATLKELLKFQKIQDKFGASGVSTVANELFGVEGGRVAKVLLEQGEQGLANFLAKMDEQASLDQRIEQKISTLSSALESLGGVWETAVGTIGSAFADDIRGFADWASAIIENDLTPWLKENKRLVKIITASALAFTGLSVAVLSAKFALSGATSIFAAAAMPFKLFTATKAIKELDKFNGGLSLFARLSKTSFGSAIKSFLSFGRVLLTTPIGLVIGGIALAGLAIYRYWQPLSSFFSGFWSGLMQGLAPLKPVIDGIGKAFSFIWDALSPIISPILSFFGDLFSFEQVAEGGARSLGEAFGLFIGNAISGVVGLLQNFWTDVTTAFDGGILGIGKLILDWSPIGLFHKAFAAVLSWFGIDLPAQFSNFGQNLIDGLVGGISNAWNLAKEKVSELGSGIKNWFAEKLGIHSPSRVFKGYGHNIVEGLAVGIENKQPLASQATSALGHAVGSSFQSEKSGWFDDLWSGVMQFGTGLRQFFALSDWHDRPLRTPNFNPAAANDGLFADYQPLNRESVAERPAMTVHFNPTINLNGNGGDVMNQVQQGLQMSLHEFEQLLNRVLDQRQRRAY